MAENVKGKSLLDLEDDLDMNNDSLELLMDKLYESEVSCPPGFMALLRHVHSNYEEVGKDLRALRQV